MAKFPLLPCLCVPARRDIRVDEDSQFPFDAASVKAMMLTATKAFMDEWTEEAMKLAVYLVRSNRPDLDSNMIEQHVRREGRRLHLRDLFGALELEQVALEKIFVAAVK